MNQEYEVLKSNISYEIQKEAPHTIRLRLDKTPVREVIGPYDGFVYVHLKYHIEKKHKLIAEQFLEKDPNKPCLVHLNGNMADNRKDNICYMTIGDAQRNTRAINGTLPKIIIDVLPENAVKVNECNGWEFDKLYCTTNGEYYVSEKGRFRKLNVFQQRSDGRHFIQWKDISGNRRRIGVVSK